MLKVWDVEEKGVTEESTKVTDCVWTKEHGLL